MLGALAQETRLAIYRQLIKRGPEGYAAGEVAAKLGLPAPTLSFHLKALAQTNLISVRRDGRFLYYSVNFPQMNGLVEFLTENCCGVAGSNRKPVCLPVAPKIEALRTRRRA